MNIKFLIQTKFDWPEIINASISSFKNEFILKGYEFELLNIKNSNSSFVDTLIEYCQKNNLTHIGCIFDDLIFSKINIPHHNELSSFNKNSEINYIRFDGRPKGSKENTFNLSDIPFGLIKNRKYFFSTVMGVFSLKLLEKIKEYGATSAWDIEEIDIEKFNNKYQMCNLKASSFAPIIRTSYYENLIIKGKPNIFYLLKFGFTMSVSGSAIKIIKYKLSNLFQK